MVSSAKGPERTCVACRQSKQQDQLVRYVVAPDGTLLVDYRHRLPGRGAYTCIAVECVKIAVERKQFQRSFRGNCREAAFESLVAELIRSVEQKIINLLGMGRKSGQVVSGSSAVMTNLRQGTGLSLVIMTKDISTAIAEKVKTLSERQQIKCSQLLSKDLLGQILGKGERSVVGIQTGALADAILIELQRYTQLVREN